MAKLTKLIDSQALHSLIQNKTEGVKILDCTYARHIPPELDNLEEFNKKTYGNLSELLKMPSPNRDTYLASHIPTANFIDINIATCPKPNEPFALYEPEIFEKYVQFLGINQDDHLVLYGRGLLGGMLWAGKTYGHDNISILNGGLADWQAKGYPVENFNEVPIIPTGNWKANFRSELMVKFEEIVQHEPENSTDLKELAKKFNILDVRNRGVYEGKEDAGFDSTKITGSYIPGTKNIPIAELVDPNGNLKSNEEIEKKLKEANFDPKKPCITMCSMGTGAALLAFILGQFNLKAPIRVYNGSMKEMEARDPKKISGR
uniref:Rhodanese domain-containing protein n=1 Tax=Acrobeloides nanus TaxID=290746 RepID=A0A914C3G9_9BILA